MKTFITGAAIFAVAAQAACEADHMRYDTFS